jgi:GNAT superfamily N-acetyltransferase
MTAVSIEIQTLEASALPALLSLYKHLHPCDEPLPAPEVVEAVWQEALQNPRCRYFGVFAGDQLVASCTIMIIPNLTRACKPYGVIENVVTHQEHRQQGLGKAVLAHALQFAWSQTCYKVLLSTGRKDEATLQFYEHAGFDRNAKQAFVAKPPSP